MALPQAACRFHRELVEDSSLLQRKRHVTPARNGSDLLLLVQGAKPFTWGGEEPRRSGSQLRRRRYIDALVIADSGDYTDLEDFLLG